VLYLRADKGRISFPPPSPRVSSFFPPFPGRVGAIALMSVFSLFSFWVGDIWRLDGFFLSFLIFVNRFLFSPFPLQAFLHASFLDQFSCYSFVTYLQIRLFPPPRSWQMI